MNEDINIKPIGVIRTPFKDTKGMPIQGVFSEDTQGTAELFPEYEAGLKDLDKFSHAILIFHFNRTQKANITAKPFLEDVEHGIFAIRSPFRPNHIGLSIVKIKEIKENKLIFSEVDMLDNTPLLDIKPYITHFDDRSDIKNGWYEKHFQDKSTPDRARLKNDIF